MTIEFKLIEVADKEHIEFKITEVMDKGHPKHQSNTITPNKIQVDPSGKYITIYLYGGKTTIIDAEDYDKVKMYHWCSHKHGNTFYVTSNTSRSLGKRKEILLHRLILGLNTDESADHINGDGLDNRKCNLRIATVQQNMANSGKMCKQTTSRFKGVNWNIHENKWHVRIMYMKKRLDLGYYYDENLAGFAYDKKAKELFGEYARLNFPENG